MPQTPDTTQTTLHDHFTTTPVTNSLPDIIESLYVINKHAKRYRDQATQHYQHGNKTHAHHDSTRKNALYNVKTRVLEHLTTHNPDYITRIEHHHINNNPFYCFYFPDEYSFHTPVDNWNGPAVTTSRSETLHEFHADGVVEDTRRSLDTALQHIHESLGINANHYLDTRYVYYGGVSTFTGWEVLPHDHRHPTQTASATAVSTQ